MRQQKHSAPACTSTFLGIHARTDPYSRCGFISGSMAIATKVLCTCMHQHMPGSAWQTRPTMHLCYPFSSAAPPGHIVACTNGRKKLQRKFLKRQVCCLCHSGLLKKKVPTGQLALPENMQGNQKSKEPGQEKASMARPSDCQGQEMCFMGQGEGFSSHPSCGTAAAGRG